MATKVEKVFGPDYLQPGLLMEDTVANLNFTFIAPVSRGTQPGCRGCDWLVSNSSEETLTFQCVFQHSAKNLIVVGLLWNILYLYTVPPNLVSVTYAKPKRLALGYELDIEASSFPSPSSPLAELYSFRFMFNVLAFPIHTQL
ncbi:hypothetical protein OUZ56_029934 [Daphnia magna]|uniref:Uncharacterized protein n=1 Tax=Daphnia magna TaxID=35525 RepID=A0ABR0B8C0_9CRUS|nr:hypothetical protein OUZ56_029934 [Daphnia magna]